MPPKPALGAYRGTNLSALRAMAAAEAAQESTLPEEIEQTTPTKGHSSLVQDYKQPSKSGRSVRSERAEATYKINGEYVEDPEDIIAEYRRKELNHQQVIEPQQPTEEPPKYRSPRTSHRSRQEEHVMEEEPRMVEEEPHRSVNEPHRSVRLENDDYEPRLSRVSNRVSQRISQRAFEEPTVDEIAPSNSVRKSVQLETSPKPLVFERRPLNEFVEENNKPLSNRFIQSPRSPPMSGKIPVEEYEVKRTYTAASPSTKIPTTVEDIPPKISAKSERKKKDDELDSLNSRQLREIIRRLQDEKTSRRTRTETPREEVPVQQTQTKKKESLAQASPHEDKIPMWDEDSGRWVLINKSKIEEMQQGFANRTNTNATAAQQPEEGGELDFDNMTAVQQREFTDEMRVKFNILRRGYPQFGIPEVSAEDDPKWLWGMYQQFLDMAKHESSLPFYRNGMTIFFFLTDALLSYLGIPCNGEFYKFHNSYFSDYNSLLIELGESWGPVMDVSWRTETKLALMIGWNTLVFVVMKFITTKFGDKFAGVMEAFVKNLNAKDFIQGNGESSILSKAKEKIATETSQGADANPMGNVMGNLMNMFGGMMGGNNGGGGNNKMMEGLLSGLGSMMTAQTDGASRQRRRPDFDDV